MSVAATYRPGGEGGGTWTVVVAFPGSRFTGQVRPAIEDLVARKVIRVVDAMVVREAADGSVTVLELEDLLDDPESGAVEAIMADHLDLLSAEDAETLTAELEPGSSALALAFEQVWMNPVRDAVVASGGLLLADLQVPREVVDEVLAAVVAG